jgi:hypothetical protein
MPVLKSQSVDLVDRDFVASAIIVLIPSEVAPQNEMMSPTVTE